MSKEWEHKQLSKLKLKQEKRILDLQKRVEKESPLLTAKPNQTFISNAAEDNVITMIAAAGTNNELGLNNELVWHLPADFKRFKQLTTGHHIIMGRKTFESFPKPLPNRTHVVITRNKDYHKEGIIVVHTMEEAIAVTKGDTQPFIIGGGEIYKMGLEFAQKIELTRVQGAFKADTFFQKSRAQNGNLLQKKTTKRMTVIPMITVIKHILEPNFFLLNCLKNFFYT